MCTHLTIQKVFSGTQILGLQNVLNCSLVGLPGGTSGKERTYQCRRRNRHGFDPWVGKIPWRRPWQPTPVFLNPIDRGAWWATVHRVTKSQTQLKRLSTAQFKQNKTKQNKKPSSNFFANLGLNIEGLCSFHCGIVRRNVRVFFFFF